MSSIALALLTLAVAAPPEPAETVPSVVQSEVEPPATVADATEPGTAPISPSKQMRKRTGRELLAAVRETLPRLNDPEDDYLEAAIEEMMYLYQELHEDTEMARSQREYYKGKVQLRLVKLGEELKKRIARNKRIAKSKTLQKFRDAKQADHQLGQQIGRGPAGAPPLMGRGPMMGTQGRLPNDDYGQQLVDLIQRTIAPGSWDVNGGLGSIYYWRPGRALVIRQTGAVHDDLGGALDQLRRAGN